MGSSLKNLSNEIATIIASIAPSVVEIDTIRAEKRWFGRRDVASSPSGAGVILRSSGLVVTNHHVVEAAERISVSLSDRRRFEAELIGVDPVSDVAVLSIPVRELPVARIRAEGGARVGEVVFAVGHPLGLIGSVSSGIVSSSARFDVGPGSTRPRMYIQTDAALNPGNSGGALVGCDGAVLGITTWGYSSDGVHGLAFAIPISAVLKIVEKLVKDRTVRYGTLGLSGSEMFLPADAVKAHGLTQDQALQVEHVDPSGPAAKAGIEQYDWIFSIEGRPVESLEAFLDVVDEFIDTEVELRILRLTGEMGTKRVKVDTLS